MDHDQFMLFENSNNVHLKQEMTQLPERMENPYKILKRFIRWEIMDLEAMIETLDTKNEMERRKNMLEVQRTKHQVELFKLQRGNTFFSTFQSRQGKINRITELNERIEYEDKEIDCADCLTKIVFLYLHDAAIPFFRLDKLGVYNGAINLYAMKQIQNCANIMNFYNKVIGQNQIEIGGHLGNQTVLDEKSYMLNNFQGKFEPEKVRENETSIASNLELDQSSQSKKKATHPRDKAQPVSPMMGASAG